MILTATKTAVKGRYLYPVTYEGRVYIVGADNATEAKLKAIALANGGK